MSTPQTARTMAAEPLIIANPLYDSIFKFFMQDLDTARMFLSGLLEMEVLELAVASQERALSEAKEKPAPAVVEAQKRELPDFALGHIRYDFVARVLTKERGEQLVMVELQKVRLLNDAMRFRRYLGAQYSSKSNQREGTDKNGRAVKNPIPIYSVYILGERLDEISGYPLIGVFRRYINVSTGEAIAARDPFIEALTHDCRLVIVPDLPGHQSTELEKMLMIFDQTQQLLTAKGQMLKFEPGTYPAKYAQLLRRLEMAAKTPELREEMEREDDQLEEYRQWAINDAIKDKALAEAIQKQAEAQRQKAEADIRLASAARALLSSGQSMELVASMFGMTRQELDVFLEGRP